MKVNYIYDKGAINEALMRSYPIIASDDDKAGAASVLKKNFKTVTYIEKMDRSPYWISDTEEHEKGNTTYKIYLKDPSEVDALSDFCDKSLGWLTIGIGVEEPDYETYIDGTEVLIFTKGGQTENIGVMSSAIWSSVNITNIRSVEYNPSFLSLKQSIRRKRRISKDCSTLHMASFCLKLKSMVWFRKQTGHRLNAFISADV